jgi:hypothetical protein
VSPCPTCHRLLLHRVVIVASRLLSSYPLAHVVIAVSHIASSLIVASSSLPLALRLVVVFVVVIESLTSRCVASFPLAYLFSCCVYFFLRCVVILARLVVAVSRVVSSHLVSPHPSHQRSLSHYVIVADLPVLSSLSLALCRLISYPLTHLIDAVSHITSSLLIVALSSSPITHRPMVGCCVQRLSQFIALRHVPSRVSSRISRVASLCCVALSSPTARPWHSRHLLF